MWPRPAVHWALGTWVWQAGDRPGLSRALAGSQEELGSGCSSDGTPRAAGDRMTSAKGRGSPEKPGGLVCEGSRGPDGQEGDMSWFLPSDGCVVIRSPEQASNSCLLNE